MKRYIKKITKFFSSKRSKNDIRLFLLFIGTVMIRRGLWGFMDVYLFPHNEKISFILSILFGIIILIITDSNLSDLK